MWCPDKCRTSSCNVSNHNEQKQHVYRPPDSGALITFLCTEQRCFNKCAFCLNIATHKRHANGFSPVCTRKWVFKFHDIPNCLPQYSQRYSRTGAVELELDLPWICCCWCSSELFSELLPELICETPKPGGGSAASAAECGGQGYKKFGATGIGLSALDALGGRLLPLLLWWLLCSNKSVGCWEFGDNGRRSPLKNKSRKKKS